MQKIISPITRWLDRTGMYRVVTLSLLALSIYSLLLALLGESAYRFSEQAISLTVAVTVSLITNIVISRVLHVSANHESALITALILFFLFAPGFTLENHSYIALAGVVAMVSKYLIAPRKQHIFNAAAVGAVALSLTGVYEAWWWVASPEMFIPLIIVGVLVVQKVRRWPMVLSFLSASFIAFLVRSGFEMSDVLYQFWVIGPALFLAIFMLTEPFTTPPQRKQQIFYGVVVGVLMQITFFSPVIAMTPELALVIGNVLFYPFTLKQKLLLTFIEKRTLAENTIEYIFKKPAGMHFKPGQYVEWMLPHQGSDSRGPRRYFTIASAPEEEHVRVALRVMPEGGSSYKQALEQLQPGDHLIASQLAGDFMLPADDNQKIALVAGGIGVTPFRSFYGHLMAEHDTRDVALYYANNSHAEIAYTHEFANAEETLGWKWVNVLAKESHPECEYGFLTTEIIKKHTPDYVDRVWFLSGPPGMVNAYTTLLREMRVPRSQIVTDFFPGLA